MGTFAKVADLPIEVEAYALKPLSFKASEDFERLSTLVVMRGPDGLEGWGEDVTYEGLDQIAHQDAGAVHDLSGRRTFGEFCELIGSLDLFPVAPEREVSRLYRRWAYESAGLDLALRQAGRSLADVLEREARPVTFVASMRLGGTPGSDAPSSIEPLLKRLATYPSLRFKLDPTNDWDDDLIAALVETGAVNSLDLKGQYKGTVVDVETDPDLYRKLAAAFPEAWLEDPDLSVETAEVLAPHLSRITWDAPIHTIDDIENLPFLPNDLPAELRVTPKMVNIKPSRLGGVQSLFDAYDFCDANGIAMYGGGQWELGAGRGHIQYLASIFHSDTSNDTAPAGYNDPSVPTGLPTSPLPVAIDKTGFRWL